MPETALAWLRGKLSRSGACSTSALGRLTARTSTAKARAPVPDELWDGEPSVDAHERMALADAVAHLRKEVSRQQPGGVPLAHDTRAWVSIERIAIGRALIELGYLQLRRSRISLPIRQRRAKEIS